MRAQIETGHEEGVLSRQVGRPMTFPAGSRNLAVISGASAPDWSHDLAPVGDNHVKGRSHAVNHNVKEKAWCSGGRAPDNPGTAHLAGRVVELATIAGLLGVQRRGHHAGEFGGECMSVAGIRGYRRSCRSQTWGASALLPGCHSAARAMAV